MIGTDSHTPNAGGLGMVAIGVGGADAVDVMTGFPFNVRWPKLIGVHLTGELSGWTAPKDVILKVAEILTVKGGTGAIVEYFGPGADSHHRHRQGHHLQHGRRDRRHHLALRLRRRTWPRYLKSTGREAIADAANAVAADLRADPEVAGRPGRVLRPGHRDRPVDAASRMINGPHTPDLAHQVSRGRRRGRGRGLAARDQRRPHRLVHELVLRGHHPGRVASPARPRRRGCGPRPQLLITPGSEQVRATIERDGLLADLEAIGGDGARQRLRPLHRPVVPPAWTQLDQVNTIVNSYNRNFPKRNDGSANTLSFVTSPRHGHRLALAGRSTSTPSPTCCQRRRRGGPPRRSPSAIDLPRRGLRPGRGHLHRTPGRAVRAHRRRGRGRPRVRPPPAAPAVPRRGTARTTSACPWP